jgi:hypothetical protein
MEQIDEIHVDDPTLTDLAARSYYTIVTEYSATTPPYRRKRPPMPVARRMSAERLRRYKSGEDAHLLYTRSSGPPFRPSQHVAPYQWAILSEINSF